MFGYGTDERGRYGTFRFGYNRGEKFAVEPWPLCGSGLGHHWNRLAARFYIVAWWVCLGFLTSTRNKEEL